MKDFVRAIGLAPYGVSKFLLSNLPFWRMVLAQQAHPASDSEMNLAAVSLAHMRARVWAHLFGAGLVVAPTIANGVTTNIVILHNGATPVLAVLDGELFELRDSTDTVAINVTMAAPPISGTRTDLIYLEVTREEVEPSTATEAASLVVYKRGNKNGPTVTNDLITGVGAETSRRVQIRYAIKTISGASTLEGQVVGAYTWSALPVNDNFAGAFALGDGSVAAAAALGTVDGQKRGILLATVARTVGQTTIAAASVTFVGRTLFARIDADTVDGFHAAASPTLNMLLPLGAGGVYPAAAFITLPGAGVNVDKVDGFDANATPTASNLLPLNGSIKYPNSALKTGTGQGLDADMVDGKHAAASATLNKLLPLDSGLKYPLAVLRTGTGNGLDADTVDAIHAAATVTASKLLALDAGAKYPNGAIRAGTGQGLDVDTVDAIHAAAAATASKLLPLDGATKFPLSVLHTGSGQGLDADTIDGVSSGAWAQVGHAIGGTWGFSGGVLGDEGGNFPYSRTFTISPGYNGEQIIYAVFTVRGAMDAAYVGNTAYLPPQVFIQVPGSTQIAWAMNVSASSEGDLFTGNIQTLSVFLAVHMLSISGGISFISSWNPSGRIYGGSYELMTYHR